MHNVYFKSIESLEKGQQLVLEDIVDELSFNADGLMPVVTQDVDSREVLMLAWMNREAMEKTLASGHVTYWSRSRQQFWVKGETSGHYQALQSMRLDCDGDAILCLVKQSGAACHTGRNSCFYFDVNHATQSVSVLVSQP
ncbi:MAG: phosphoribosyl-AMP cyclohydrolase [Cellvibrionaceae bacterium]|nr:phosphoribosyl-AMP cyclohydrolase [Cellvibrionaceae bacterium]